MKKGYKATNEDMTCNGFKFELDKEYKEPIAKLCSKGFHYCENPLDTLNYYNLCESKFFEIEASSVSTETKEEDTKRVAKKIKLKVELSLNDFIKASIDYIFEKCKVNKKDDSNIAVGDSSKVATSGYSSQVATSGDYSKVATSGNSSKVATSGKYSKVATSGDSSKVATSGYSSQVATSGDSSQVALNGSYSVGANIGINGTAKGKKGNWITLAEWQYDNKDDLYKPVCVKSVQIDGKNIKEDTYYRLEYGEFTEC